MSIGFGPRASSTFLRVTPRLGSLKKADTDVLELPFFVRDLPVKRLFGSRGGVVRCRSLRGQSGENVFITKRPLPHAFGQFEQERERQPWRLSPIDGQCRCWPARAPVYLF